FFFFFFFQAEDGIRDRTVTGVQTCALPISRCWRGFVRGAFAGSAGRGWGNGTSAACPALPSPPRQFLSLQRSPRFGSKSRPKKRSEERRVGKECRARWSAEYGKKRAKVSV